MAIINNIQADILESLGRFTYLTVSQIQHITGKSAGYLREQLAILTGRKLIKSFHVEVTAKVRAENMYYLLPASREIVMQKAFADDIKLPVGVPLVVRDYSHRKNFIDVHISLYTLVQSLGITLVSFQTYFDKTGNNRTAHNLEAKTKISLGGDVFFIPDGVLITEHAGKRTLFLLEMYNGKDTIRTVQQLAKHAQAIALGSPGKTFGIAANPLVISVFEYESIRDAVIKRLRENERFGALSKLYFFASLEEVKRDCKSAFKTVTGETLDFMNG